MPRRPSAKSADTPLSRYLTATRSPLTSLCFVIPLLILHEWGVRHFATLTANGVEYRVTAFTLLTRFLHSLGASGRYLPALVVVAVLLGIHIAQRDRWAFHIPLLPLMTVESVGWALPLLAVFLLAPQQGPVYQAAGEWKLLAALYLGAGVYEELIFRLGGFALLAFLLIDVARLPAKTAAPFIVLMAAIAFSGYHMWGNEPLPWQAFVFIGLRGIYYGIIFLERGFGVTVGVHTAYDLLFLALRQVSER
jgi:hypothetical protein